MNIPTLLSINWNPDPELFNLFGSIPIRYYGLLWVVGIALAYAIVHRQYHDRKIDEKTFEPLFFYCFFGILIGARLGHCLFYQPDYYLNHFWEMILPVKFLPDGGWKWTGYEGLASHGGTLGLIISLWMYCRKTKMHYMDVLDMIAVATRLLHPPCQPDELRNNRYADQCPLGICIRTRRYAAPPSGTALRSNSLFYLLPGHGLPVQTRTEEAGKQT